MRPEELTAGLAEAAAAVPGDAGSLWVDARRRRRRGRTLRTGVVAVSVAAVGAAVAFGPRSPGHGAAPASTSTAAAGAGGLLLPDVTTPIAVVGPAQLAIHDPRTGALDVTPISRLDPAASETTAVAVGPYVVIVAGGAGVNSRAVVVDSRDASQPPRPLGAARTVVTSATPGLLWLQQADGQAREVTVGGLQSRMVPALGGALVGASDVGLLVQTAYGASVVDPATGAVRWAVAGAVGLAVHGRTVAWCTGGCSQVKVSDVGGATTAVAGSPAAGAPYRGPAAFSPDGRYLALSRAGAVAVLDVHAATTTALLPGGAFRARGLTWTGDWLVVTDGTTLHAARAPTFADVTDAVAGVAGQAVVALGEVPVATGATVVAGGPFLGDGWFVAAGVNTIDTTTELCFGVLGPPLRDCLPATGEAVDARLIGAGDRQTLVGVVRDPRVASVRLMTGDAASWIVTTTADVVGMQGGYRVFAWRAPRAGTLQVEGLGPDGQRLPGASVSLR